MIIRLIKRIIFATLFIYAYNIFSVSLGIIIPINTITILLVSCFDVPALICLILFSMAF